MFSLRYFISVKKNLFFIYSIFFIALVSFFLGYQWKIEQISNIDNAILNFYPFLPTFLAVVSFIVGVFSLWITYSLSLSILLKGKNIKEVLFVDSFTFIPFLLIQLLSPKIIVAFFLCLKFVFFIYYFRNKGKFIFKYKLEVISIIASILLILAFYLPTFITYYGYYYTETTAFCFNIKNLNIIKTKDIPLWSPDKFCGIPTYTNITANSFEIFQYLVLALTSIPFVNLLDIYFWLNIIPRLFGLLISSMGMFFLTRNLGLCRLSSVICSLLTVLNYQVTVNLFYESESFFSIVFFPLLILFTRKLLIKRSIYNLILFSLAVVFSYNLFILNNLEYTKTIIFCLLFYAIIYSVISMRISPIANILLGLFVSLLLLSVRWLPFFIYSIKNKELLIDKPPSGFFSYPEMLSPPWFNYNNIPEMFSYNTNYYCGIIFLFLFFIGFVMGNNLYFANRNDYNVAIEKTDYCFFTGTCILILIYYFGYNTALPVFLHKYFPFLRIHNPSRVQFLFGYLSVILCGYGLHYITINNNKSVKNELFCIKQTIIFLLIFIIACLYLYYTRNQDISFLLQSVYKPLVFLFIGIFVIDKLRFNNNLIWKVFIIIIIYLDSSSFITNKMFNYNNIIHEEHNNQGGEIDLRAQLNYIKHNLWDEKAVSFFKRKICNIISKHAEDAPNTNYGNVTNDSFWDLSVLYKDKLLERFNYLEDEVLTKLNAYCHLPGGLLVPSGFSYNESVKQLYQENGYYRFISSLGAGDWACNITENARFNFFNAGGLNPNCFPNYRFKQYPKEYDYFFPRTNEIQGGGGNYTFYKNPRNRWILDLLNVKYVIGANLIPGLNKITDIVSENPTVLPRAYMIYDYIIDKEATSMEGIDYRNVVILDKISEKDAALLNKNKGYNTSSAKVYVKKIVGNYAVFQVKTERAGILFYSDNFDKGWKAYVDGIKTEIYRANLSFKAVIVPEGEHIVWFEFAPKSVYIGWFLTCSTLTMLFFLAYGNSKKK